jgi:hypothetical protein
VYHPKPLGTALHQSVPDRSRSPYRRDVRAARPTRCRSRDPESRPRDIRARHRHVRNPDCPIADRSTAHRGYRCGLRVTHHRRGPAVGDAATHGRARPNAQPGADTAAIRASEPAADRVPATGRAANAGQRSSESHAPRDPGRRSGRWRNADTCGNIETDRAASVDSRPAASVDSRPDAAADSGSSGRADSDDASRRPTRCAAR